MRRSILQSVTWESLLILLLVLAAVGPAVAHTCVKPSPDLIFWWPGDDNELDIVNSNDGILQGGASFDDGLVAHSFALDGINDWVEVPDASNLNFGTNDFTVDLWVNFNTTVGEQVLIEKFIQKFSERSLGWTLTKLENNDIIFAIDVPDSNFGLGVSPKIKMHKWNFITLTRAGNTFTIYWNGMPLGSNSVEDNLEADLDSTASLKFGHRCSAEDTPGCQDDRGFYLNGLIDEVEIFNRALSEAEIKSIFNAGSAGKCKPIAVDIDIKPGSYSNSINLKSKGKLTVAILTTDEFDANNVDPDTVKFAGANPLSWKMKDVDNDGDDDMIFYFKTQELDLTKDSTKATLEGETIEGIQIKGTDLVKILHRNKRHVVTSFADNGPSTFRLALVEAVNGDMITFDPSVFPPNAPATITLSNALPELSQGNLTIDASNAGVILNGKYITAPDSQLGLSISSDHNIIRGLQITGFSDAGIGLYGGAQYNVIGGDRSVGNGPLGQGNLISGNGNFGIGLWDESTSHNTIQGNYIGINIDGTEKWGHARDGIHSNGATFNQIVGNVIGGNECGVYLCCVVDGGNTITGNLIGVGPDGSDLGNGQAGVVIDRTSHNVVGPGNTIAYNLGDGILFEEDTLYNTVTQNSIRDNGGQGIVRPITSQITLQPPLVFSFDLQAGHLAGWDCANCTVEIFSDTANEGAIYEGQVVSDSIGVFTFNKVGGFTGPHLTATATSTDGSTSGFSFLVSGSGSFLILQPGNQKAKVPIIAKTSRELQDNRIGGDYGDFINFIPDDDIFALGLKWVRVGFGGSNLNWQRVEKESGEYTVDPVEESAITYYANNGINILLNLGVGPGDGITGTRFITDEEIDRYINYVLFMVDHFQGRVRYYELWNEPGGIDPPTGLPSNIGIDVDIYASVISKAVKKIRDAGLEAKIVIGALGGNWISNFPGYGEFSRSILHMEYLRRLLTSGVAPEVDAISWHPFYGNMPGDPYYNTYPDFVRSIKDLAAAEGFKGEYFAEEIRYYPEPNTEGWGQSAPVVTEKVAAKYYARAIVMHLGLDFTVSTAGQPGYGGLVSNVIRHLCTVMEAASLVSVPMDVQSQATNIVSYSFSLQDGSRLVALWTNGEAVDDDPGVSAMLTFPGSSAQQVIGMDVLYGFEQPLISKNDNGSLVIRSLLIKDYPTILHLTNYDRRHRDLEHQRLPKRH